MSVALSKLEIANKIKARMIAFTKANEKTWQKNTPPYLRDDLADLVLDLMAQAWDAGYATGAADTVNFDPAEVNPYVKS